MAAGPDDLCHDKEGEEASPVCQEKPCGKLQKLAIEDAGRSQFSALESGEPQSLLFEMREGIPASDEEIAAQANLLRTRGKFQEAISMYESISTSSPTHRETLVPKGLCCKELGRVQNAQRHFQEAIAHNSDDATARVHVAQLLFQQGLFEKAAEEFRRALEADSGNLDARQGLSLTLTEVGTRLKLCGQSKEGIKFYRQALEADTSYAPAHYNMGMVAFEDGNYEAALEHYRSAASLNPLYAEPHCNIGVVHKLRGELDAAIASYERCLAISPNFTIARNNMAIALTHKGSDLKAQGKKEDAIKCYEQALSYNMQQAEALYNLGLVFGEAGNLTRASFMFELCVYFCPSCAEAFNYLGIIDKENGNFDRAVQHFQTAVRLKPALHQALNNLGVLYTMQGKAKEALEVLKAAITACPTHPESHNDLGVLLRDVGDIKGALAAYESCLRVCPTSRSASQNQLLALNYVHEGEELIVSDAHAQWGINFQKMFNVMPPPTPNRDLNRVLRVGYISPDFFTHSVSYFAEALLTHHDPETVQIVCYSCPQHPDARTKILREKVESKGGLWREVTRMTEEAVAAKVREDEIDILVELTGHTANNRLGVLAQRPSPIQVTWIGYPNSTGLAAVDYRFVDAVVDPVDTRQAHVEELVRLPATGCFLCYTPPVSAGPVAPLPALNNGGVVTFGTFNALAKIQPPVLKLWARVLHAVPNSRLLIKGKPFACSTMQEHFRSQLTALGVDASRIDLLPLEHLTSNHLSKYSLVDISLDPFPYAGTTTTCEAMYMGVPCVTLAGGCHAHNVGKSLMTAMGLTDWIAHSHDEYVAIAQRFATNLPALRELRAEMRERMLNSHLCDHVNYVKGVEDVFRQLWHRWIRDHPPQQSTDGNGNADTEPSGGAEADSTLPCSGSKLGGNGGSGWTPCPWSPSDKDANTTQFSPGEVSSSQSNVAAGVSPFGGNPQASNQH